MVPDLDDLAAVEAKIFTPEKRATALPLLPLRNAMKEGALR